MKLINGDSRYELSKIESNSIDLIITDPPYKVISGGKPHKPEQPGGMLSKNDGKIFKHNSINPEEWFPELYRVLKNGCHCYVMVNTINLENYLRISRECGFLLHSVLSWKKNNATPSRWYMKNCEFVLFLRKGKAKMINNNGSMMIHEFKNIIGNKKHPTEKPVDLMEFYIKNSSQIGELILDPFMGAGSTGIACKNTDRNFIGIELDREYFDIAEERIKKTEFKEVTAE